MAMGRGHGYATPAPDYRRQGAKLSTFLVWEQPGAEAPGGRWCAEQVKGHQE